MPARTVRLVARRCSMSGAIALIITGTGRGVIAAKVGISEVSSGSGGIRRALGQTSEMYVHVALSAMTSQRASRCAPWQAGMQASSPTE